MSKQGAFTLIELILVLVLMGILAAVALPRLQLGSQFEQGLQANNLVGLLRLAQLRTMNDPEALTNDIGFKQCGRVVIALNGFSLSKDCDSAVLLTDDQLKSAEQQGLFLGKTGLTMTVEPSYTLPLVLQFGKKPESEADKNYLSEASRLGRPFINDVQLSEPLEITIGGKTVHIETEGYIHAP
ncbi:prepilin-type N-terminal cleavage/methylation domain-containing protein [uncultured Oceanisphaera sp.]|uniref:prepilin-type N-terminal cleavage/methylation domain-containing protein n=1 Tax=uncultured Oceanisphaera sp. TaxID=353858 RepID=UPI00263488AE|nr:prepilin-type N-terminal cleavage/methylation domain-containing protein [uncultured Oceanisphaera sp.]